MTATITAVSGLDTESLLTDEEINEPAKRPFLTVVVGKGKVHAWTIAGFKCGKQYSSWFIDKNEPDVTCKQCLHVLESERRHGES